MDKTEREVTSSGSVSECLGVLYELEAQVAGARALINIDSRNSDPHGDPDGSLLQAVRLLEQSLAMSDQLRELLEPEVSPDPRNVRQSGNQAAQLALVPRRKRQRPRARPQ